MKWLKTNKYLFFVLFFALLNIGAIFFIFGLQTYSDSYEYFKAIDWFRGEGMEVQLNRLLRPLGPLLAVPFEFLGRGAGLIVQNIFFYLFSALLIFKIGELIYNYKVALLASIFFVTATPVLEVGLSYLTDMGGWFFYLLSIFLTLLYFKTFKTNSAKLIILNGFLSGLGFLMKETGGLGVLFFSLMVLFCGNFNLKEKIFKIISFGAFFLIPVLSVQILMFKYFQFTHLDWYLENKPSLEGEALSLIALRYLGQVFRALGILWIFVLIGVWQELQQKNWKRIKIFLSLIPASFSFLFWTVGGGGRVAFIFALPLGILLAAYGCQKIKPLFIALIVILIIALNYWFVSINQQVPFTDIIYNFLLHK